MSEISRNAPCPCGSGEKYKKCCLAKDEAAKPRIDEDAVILCMPTRGSVSHETLATLENHTDGLIKAKIRVARKPVDEARNLLAKAALEVVANPPVRFRDTFILWLDDDAWLPPGVLSNMVHCMREPNMQGCDALFGWFCTRAPHAPPVAYRRLDDPNSYPKIRVDCSPGDVVQIEAAGFHCVLMRPSLLQRVGPDPFTPRPGVDEGEDWAFCRRAKDIGAKLGVATGLPAVHVDPRDGTGYLPGEPAFLIEGTDLRRITLDHTVNGATKSAEVREYGMKEAEEAQRRAVAEQEAAIKAELQQRRKITEGAA